MNKGVAPEVKAPSDIDPREFLLEIDFANGEIDQPLELKVHYFACDDEEGWCRAVSHQYRIELRRDRDAGSVRSAGAQGGPDRQRPGGRGGFQQRPRPDMAELFSRMDTDGDGSIARSEARGRMIDRFDLMDADGNGSISREEMSKHFERMRASGNRSRPPR